MNTDYKVAFVKDNLYVSAGTFLTYLKGIILLPVLIKTVGVSTYGAYALLMAYASVLQGISSFGIRFRYQRFMPSAPDTGTRADLFYFQFSFHLIAASILTLACIAGDGLFRKTFLTGESAYASVLVGLTLFATFVFAQATDYVRYTNRMKYFALATTAYPYLNILLVIVFSAIPGFVDLDFLLFANVISMLLVSAPLAWMVYKELGYHFPRLAPRQVLQDIRLGIPLVFVYITDFVMAGSDRFIIALYLTSTSVGYYNPAYMLGSLVIMVPKVFGVVLPPLLSKAVDQKMDLTAQDMLNKSVRFYLLLVIPYIVGCIALSDPILELLANREVAQASRFISPLIATGMLFYGLSIILAHGIAFVKMQTKVIFYSNLIAGVTNFALNAILIYFFRSIQVAGIVSLTSFVISFLFLHIRTRNLMKIDYDLNFVAKVLLASLVMGAYVFGLSALVASKILLIGVALVSGILLYVFLLFAFRIFEEGEIAFMKLGIRKVLGK